jgi:hypothetical protein
MRRRAVLSGRVSWLLLACVCAAGSAAAQNVQVTAANPSSGAQGTTSLLVRISGKNFAKGATAEFFLSGSTNPDGIVVHGTQYVSSSEVDATIDIAATASIASFDIKVTNTSGRSGKGSDLFNVVQKVSCILPGLPAGLTQVAQLNPGASGSVYGTALGINMKTARVTVGTSNVVMLAVGRTGGAEVFFIDPSVLPAAAGALPGPGFVDTVNPHATLALPSSGWQWVNPLAIGDIDGDGTPDILASGYGAAAVFRGARDGTGHVTFPSNRVYPLALPPTVGTSLNYGKDGVLANLDGVPGDEIVVAQSGVSAGHNSEAGYFHLFRWTGTGVAFVKSVMPLLSPALTLGDGFGATVAVGSLAGNPASPDLVGSGRQVVWILPDPWSAPVTKSISQIAPITLATTGPGLPVGFKVTVADADGDLIPDVLSTSDWGSSGEDGTNVRGVVFRASVGPEDPTFTFQPIPGMQKGWSTEGVQAFSPPGAPAPSVVVGAPNVDDSNQCTNNGAAYLFPGRLTATAPWTPVVIRPPSLNASGGGSFGWSTAVVDGLNLLIISEDHRDVSGITNAGQVYVYRVDLP